MYMFVLEESAKHSLMDLVQTLNHVAFYVEIQQV